jgi:hypothetical protein
MQGISELRRRGLIQPAFSANIALLLCSSFATGQLSPADQYELDDVHFHLTNYIQQGTDIQDLVKIMGAKVGRVALFGIPLQQQWSYANSGDFAPTYYLQTDAPLYYYSFTDAYIAMAYRSLPKEQQERFDPMITGFNPADMYAADHIRRVLQTFPGVFSGIGEFTIHKEFVSAKVAGETASLLNPALDKILDFAGRPDSQRHGCALRQSGIRACISFTDEKRAKAPSQDHDHLGPYRHGPSRSPCERPCCCARSNSQGPAV